MRRNNGRVEGASVEQRTLIIPGGPAAQGEPAIEKSEESYIDETGQHDITELRLRHDASSRVLHTASEIGGLCCICERPLHRDYVKESRCVVCSRPVCPDDARIIKESDGEGGDVENVYCPECLRRKAWGIVGWFLLLVSLAAIVVFLLTEVL